MIITNNGEIVEINKFNSNHSNKISNLDYIECDNNEISSLNNVESEVICITTENSENLTQQSIFFY